MKLTEIKKTFEKRIEAYINKNRKPVVVVFLSLLFLTAVSYSYISFSNADKHQSINIGRLMESADSIKVREFSILELRKTFNAYQEIRRLSGKDTLTRKDSVSIYELNEELNKLLK